MEKPSFIKAGAKVYVKGVDRFNSGIGRSKLGQQGTIVHVDMEDDSCKVVFSDSKDFWFDYSEVEGIEETNTVPCIDTLKAVQQERFQRITELKEQLKKAEEDLKNIPKIAITYGDLGMWRGKIFVVAKTPMLNEGKVCGLATNSSDCLAWYDIEGKETHHNYKFLKITSSSLNYDIQNNPNWIDGQYCKVVG